MKISGAFLQVHGKEQAHQPQVMIAMQMADKDVIYFVDWDLVSHQLHLSAFTAVDQKISVLNVQVL
jgi:anti-sigma-K factor RskA